MTICNKILTPTLVANLDPRFYWQDGSDSISNQPHIDHIVSAGVSIDPADQTAFDDLSCILPDGSDEAYPQWIFGSLNKSKIIENSITTITITGCYFSPNTVVSMDDVSITNTDTMCTGSITITVDSNGAGLGLKSIYLDGIEVGQVEVIQNTWIDFRTGGSTIDTTQFELINIAVNNVVRDANGIGSAISGGWGLAIGIPEFFVDRSTTNGIQLIYYIQNSGSAMFGCFADGHDTDTSLYNEMHLGGYLSSASNFWGFYAYGNQNNSQSVASYDRIKMNFPTTLSPGSAFEVYGLTDTDGFDGGTLLYSSTMPAGTQDAGNNIYPCLIPNNSPTARLQAFNVSGE